MAKKNLDIGILEIQKGGRGNTAKKPSDLGWSKQERVAPLPDCRVASNRELEFIENGKCKIY